MSQTKFSSGQIVATPGAIAALEDAGQQPAFFLSKHLSGDYGLVDKEDWKANEQALIYGGRLLSAYKTTLGVKFWIITEAEDDAGQRAATTLLLPDEY